MNTKRFGFLIILLILTSALLSVQKLTGWRWDGIAFVKQPLTKNDLAITKIEGKFSGKDHDCLEIIDNRLTLSRCEKLSERHEWRSPGSWQVREVVYADLNRDGIKEFVLLVWRSFDPWPIDKYLPNGGRISTHHDNEGMSCHIILIGWDGHKYRELWAGSALVAPLSDIQIEDIDGDRHVELLAIEKDYDESGRGNLVVWKWQGFGFSLLDRIDGKFSEFSLIQSSNGPMIITD